MVVSRKQVLAAAAPAPAERVLLVLLLVLVLSHLVLAIAGVVLAEGCCGMGVEVAAVTAAAAALCHAGARQGGDLHS